MLPKLVGSIQLTNFNFAQNKILVKFLNWKHTLKGNNATKKGFDLEMQNILNKKHRVF